MRLGDLSLKAEDNNFTLVRLILASAVIYTHSYWLVLGVSEKDDLSGLLGATVSTFAVDGFFFLSGFLVYPSLLRLGAAGRFLVARGARLWPGLIVSILATVAGGAFVTTAAGLAYLGGDTTKFVLMNGTFLEGFFNLTGVTWRGGELAPVNGSLWTLPWEARCYLGLALLGLLGLTRPALMKWVVLPLTLAGALVWDVPAVQHLVASVAGDGLVFKLNLADRLWPLFALGAGAYAWRDRIPMNWGILALLFLLMLGANRLGLGLHARALFVGYLVLCCGLLTARKFRISGRWPDYSYGMYIYAFPVMMVVQGVAHFKTYPALALANFAATLPLAALSWHFVEKPVLDAFKRRRAPAPEATVQAA